MSHTPTTDKTAAFDKSVQYFTEDMYDHGPMMMRMYEGHNQSG